MVDSEDTEDIVTLPPSLQAPATASLTYIWGEPSTSGQPYVIFTEGTITQGYWRHKQYTLKDGVGFAGSLAKRFFEAIDLARTESLNGRGTEARVRLRSDLRLLGHSAAVWFLPNEALEAANRLPEGSILQIQTTEYFIPWELLPHDGTGKTWGETFIIFRVALPGESGFHRQGVRPAPTGQHERLIITSDAAGPRVIQALCKSLDEPRTISRPSGSGLNWTLADLTSKAKGVKFLAFLCHSGLEGGMGQVLWLKTSGNTRECLDSIGCTLLALADDATIVLASCHSGAGQDIWGGTSLAFAFATSRRCTVAASWANVYDISGAEVIKQLAEVADYGQVAMANTLRNLRNRLADADYFDVLAFGITDSPVRLGG